ncbi:hypothetical protein RSAG8_09373, partial [Rhizoctonia solani AG-8 WAC10335]
MKSSAFLILAITGLASTGAATPVGKRAQPKGIDVSGHQGNVDWAAQKKAGIKFAYVKATEGTSFKSTYFSQQYDGSYKVSQDPGLFWGRHPVCPDTIPIGLEKVFEVSGQQNPPKSTSPGDTNI